MLISNLHSVIFFFTLYAMVGWLAETVYCSVGQRKLVKRGFLRGPYCPIYGFGAMAILLATQRAAAHPALVFVLAMLAASIVEYLTSWLMEKLLNLKLWDYRSRVGNINGRVCLLNAILFGLMGCAMVYFLHPLLLSLLALIPLDILSPLVSLFAALLAVDFIHALHSHYRQHLAEAGEVPLSTSTIKAAVAAWRDDHHLHQES